MLLPADGRLSTQSGSKWWREAAVWTDPGSGRPTFPISGRETAGGVRCEAVRCIGWLGH
jgi:hypothetical protein